MIENSSDYLIHVLKCFIHGQKPEYFTGEVDNLLKLADINYLKAVVGYMAINNPNMFDQTKCPGICKYTMKTIGYFANRSELMKALCERMNEEGIDHLLFKGFVVRDYYPVPELRSYGDIDFLIRKEDRQRDDALMISEGYHKKNDWEPVFSYGRDTEYYEIHTEVMEINVSDRADYREYFAHIWDRAIIKEKHTYILKNEDHLVYLITHIAKHVKGSGAGIRLYLDIAIMLNALKDSLDWKYFVAELKKIELYDFAKIVFYIAEKYFDVYISDKLYQVEEGEEYDGDTYDWNVDEEFIKQFLNITLEGGVFGFETRDAGVDTLKRTKGSSGRFTRIGIFLRRLFPKASTIEKRYTYIQKRHWLLPVAWIHRLSITSSRWKAHTQEAKSIMRTDEKEVDKYRVMYSKLGL